MHEFLQALPMAASNPLAFVGYLVIIAAWTIVTITTRKSQAVSRRLESIPESDRLAALRLEYGLQPKKGLSPTQFLRHRRQIFVLVAYVITCLVMLAIVALAISSISAETSSATTLVLEELPIHYTDTDYILAAQLSNTGRQIAVVDTMILHILHRRRHPVTDAHHFPHAAINVVHPPKMFLNSQLTTVSILKPGEYAFPSGDIQTFELAIGADHAPHEGWIYDVQLEVTWHIPGHLKANLLLGQVYRLGWPGEPIPPEVDWGAVGMGKNFVDAPEIISP